jgi:hypothetical protein
VSGARLRRARVSITIRPRERRFSNRTPADPARFRNRQPVSKLILISVLLATIALPSVAARDTNPRRGLRRTIKYMALFYAFYLFGLLFLYGRF